MANSRFHSEAVSVQKRYRSSWMAKCKFLPPEILFGAGNEEWASSRPANGWDSWSVQGNCQGAPTDAGFGGKKKIKKQKPTEKKPPPKS